jgi:hypothetical protein
MRKTKKRNNKAGNRFLERKVHMASMYSGAYRDVTNMILRDYAASRIQKSTRTMQNKNEFENRLRNFYSNLVKFATALIRTDTTPTRLNAIKNDILRTIPDRTVAGFLRLPDLYQQIDTLRNLLTDHFPPLNEIEKAELKELVDSIIQAINVPMHDRIMVPVIPQRQYATHLVFGQGKKRRQRTNKRRK